MNIQFTLQVFAITLFCLSATANSSDLDSPIVNKPTVRTEINRGYEAAFDCSLHNAGNPRGEFRCVSGVVSYNQQNNTSTPAFKTALYFSSWQSSKGGYDVARKFNVELRDYLFNVNAFFEDFKDARKESSISVLMLCEARKIEKIYCDEVIKDVANWEAKMQ